MKKCPNCSQTFTDDNFFCLSDGTTLIPDPTISDYPPVFPTPNSGAPTQVITRPPPQTASDSSKWLYLIIGVMSTAIIALGVAFYFSRSAAEKETAKNSVEEKSNKTIEGKSAVAPNTVVADNSSNQTIVKNTNAAFSTPRPPPAVNPNLNPAGRWMGDWTSSKAHYMAVVVLNDIGGGKFTGEIYWTLQRHTNPKKIDKAGATATEYVRGAFNPATRTLSLSGYRKDDPQDIVVLDKYSLVLAENNLSLGGGSKSNGRFNLSR